MSEIFSESRELADDYRVPLMRDETPATDPVIIPLPVLPVISITKIDEMTFRLNSDVDVSQWDYVIQSADDPPAWTEFSHGAGATDGDTLSYAGSPGFVRLRITKGGTFVDSNSITMTGVTSSLSAPTLVFDGGADNWIASIDKASQSTEPSDWQFALSRSTAWAIIRPADPGLTADVVSPEDSRPVDAGNWKAVFSPDESFVEGMVRFKSEGTWSDWSNVASG